MRFVRFMRFLWGHVPPLNCPKSIKENRMGSESEKIPHEGSQKSDAGAE
jgi:hypothetical protein